MSLSIIIGNILIGQQNFEIHYSFHPHYHFLNPLQLEKEYRIENGIKKMVSEFISEVELNHKTIAIKFLNKKKKEI